MAEKMFIWFFSFRFHRNGFQIYYFLWFNHFEIVHCFWFWYSTVRNRILYIIIFQCQCTECTYSAQHMVCGGRLFCNFINIFQHIIMTMITFFWISFRFDHWFEIYSIKIAGERKYALIITFTIHQKKEMKWIKSKNAFVTVHLGFLTCTATNTF